MTQLPTKKLRRHWLQYSSKSLLVFTLIVAVACAWFTRPEVEDTPLQGGHGAIVRKKYKKYEMVGPDGTHQWATNGNWVLLDADGVTRYEGRFSHSSLLAGTSPNGSSTGKPSGTWVRYDSSGEKTMAGEFHDGVRSGTWKEWHANGVQSSEVVYAATLESGSASAPNTVSDEIEQLLGIQRSASPIPAEEQRRPIREGPARAWYDSGAVRSEGQFHADQQSGSWTFFHSDGTKQAEGNYRDGRREGVWRFWDQPGGPPRDLDFVDDRPLVDLAALIQQMSSELKTGDESARFATVWKIQSLGTRGVPLLTTALQDDSPRIKVLALRTLGRLGTRAADALVAVRPLADDTNLQVRCQALFAIAALDPASRPSMYSALLILASGVDERIRHEAIARLATPDEGVLKYLELNLNDPTVNRRAAVLEALAGMMERVVAASNSRGGPRKQFERIQAAFKKAVLDPDPKIQARAQKLFQQYQFPPWDRPLVIG